VEKCLKLLTYLPLDEIAELVKYKDERINLAKEKLAFEVTRIVHSLSDAEEAAKQAKAAFSGDESNMPTMCVPSGLKKIAEIMVAAGVAASKGEAKRLIEGGGVSVNDKKIIGFDEEISAAELETGFVLHKGKKVHIRIITE
jgi:tyrosyl-tRNA synthetase